MALVASVIEAGGTVAAAIIVAVAGGLISNLYNRERDRQQKEAQWREHALELTKLDLQRKLSPRGTSATKPIRPSVLDFLANYRDLTELDRTPPGELYAKILKGRLKAKTDEVEGQNSAVST